jgi:hypothetical protein
MEAAITASAGARLAGPVQGYAGAGGSFCLAMSTLPLRINRTVQQQLDHLFVVMTRPFTAHGIHVCSFVFCRPAGNLLLLVLRLALTLHSLRAC